MTLEAATAPDGVCSRVVVEEIDLFVPTGIAARESMHREISRRGRSHAFWNGLAWVDLSRPAIDEPVASR